MTKSLDREMNDGSTNSERREVLKEAKRQAQNLMVFFQENSIGSASFKDTPGYILWAPES